MPVRLYVACGCSAGFLLASFFLVGAHHELRHLLRQRRRGVYPKGVS
jgi:hypothetical protein